MPAKAPTEKAPLSVWLSLSMRAVDDEDSNPYSWPPKSGAALAFMSKRDNSETYVHLEQFMELVEARASNYTSLKYGDSVCEALKQIKQEIESGE